MAHKSKYQHLLEIVKPSKRLLIVPHDNPDPDAMSSAAALHYILLKKLKVRSTIAYGGIVGRAENQAMMKLLKIPTRSIDKIKLSNYSQFALLDTQPRTGNNSLKIKPTIIIDHHPPKKNSVSPHTDIRKDYGATATILTEYLLESGLDIPANLATALYYGISSETQDLGREAKSVDTQAYLTLFPHTNKRALSHIEFPKLPRDYFITLERCLRHSLIYRNIIISRLGSISIPDHVSLIADLLLRHERMSWSFVIGRYNDSLLLSVRTTRTRTHAGKLLHNIVKDLGTAGGHAMIAGGKILCPNKKPEEVIAIEEILVERFLKKMLPQGGTAGKDLLEPCVKALD